MASDVRLSRTGQLTFNRKPISDEMLIKYSEQLGQMNPRIFVTLAIDDGASCERVSEVRAIVDRGMDCGGENKRLCGEGPGPWPVFGDVPPFPIVQEYQDGKYRWLEGSISEEEWRRKNVRKPAP
jgi:hypothetical protein